MQRSDGAAGGAAWESLLVQRRLAAKSLTTTMASIKPTNEKRASTSSSTNAPSPPSRNQVHSKRQVNEHDMIMVEKLLRISVPPQWWVTGNYERWVKTAASRSSVALMPAVVASLQVRTEESHCRPEVRASTHTPKVSKMQSNGFAS